MKVERGITVAVPDELQVRLRGCAGVILLIPAHRVCDVILGGGWLVESHAQEQFAARGRYTVIPRTLVFLRHGADVLLLKGAPTKRLWANRYNGLGGHVEAGETIAEAALREVWEEAGIAPDRISGFALRALINIEGAPTGVLLCVFVGEARDRTVRASVEGTLEWIPVASLAQVDLVDGDRLLPGLLPEQPIRYGHLRYDAEGKVDTFILA